MEKANPKVLMRKPGRRPIPIAEIELGRLKRLVAEHDASEHEVQRSILLAQMLPLKEWLECVGIDVVGSVGAPSA
jgi:hypothetical protein